MTAEKANLAKKIPSSLKKVLFSTSRIPLAVGASCVTFSATRGEPIPSTLTLVSEKTHTLLLITAAREIRACNKVVLFFIEEIVFSPQKTELLELNPLIPEICLNSRNQASSF
jgi:hypothetical protein